LWSLIQGLGVSLSINFHPNITHIPNQHKGCSLPQSCWLVTQSSWQPQASLDTIHGGSKQQNCAASCVLHTPQNKGTCIALRLGPWMLLLQDICLEIDSRDETAVVSQCHTSIMMYLTPAENAAQSSDVRQRSYTSCLWQLGCTVQVATCTKP
jgi:hypothetical protein